MSCTCLVGALSLILANGLIIHGLLGIADLGSVECACSRCIITRSVEVSGGVFMLTGILAVMGGFL
ncbi:hypothetical protein [Methylobacterium sp. PvR107]|uniref:hypothetical protein n=1 Tax=Methylobacterium sp. PvR107 TaxID=2806597 RepID=UPI001AEAA8E4|nr:hypothetical protein [Methylobacterium sp. PvR107]MBP1180026.1 hypothetical protein [Methylobacterium sp. PvR107]